MARHCGSNNAQIRAFSERIRMSKMIRSLVSLSACVAVMALVAAPVQFAPGKLSLEMKSAAAKGGHGRSSSTTHVPGADDPPGAGGATEVHGGGGADDAVKGHTHGVGGHGADDVAPPQ